MSIGRTARSAGYRSCAICGLLTEIPKRLLREPECSRCHGTLHPRRPDSFHRTMALVIAAFIFYIPANLYPVMTIELLGRPDPNTILTGVQELFQSGMWEIGLLVFSASILVPLLKLIGLSYLLLCVWRSRNGARVDGKVRRDRTRLYRTIEFIGRWSMLDMFLVSMLVALVRFGAIASIEPGIGATSFALVVVITMFAAESFDPRLLWDDLEEI